ncbi:transposase [Leptolyngbya sp. FACHB-261]|uniref:transposase n=1 Tax=Leptolyngbya sp. FACHB-261 TaxID=2692806 RepID=UPI0016846378|nr:transposase [Leptolyngbya sp. FACHB-261]MBD2104568.1 transposase [Leptolyngbya sp. FACHB-261]
MTITSEHATAAQVQALARLYFETNPAQISGETIVELCDWLMSEFQSLPLNLEFSDYERYSNETEMFADIEQEHLWVSADSYDSSIYPNPIYGFIFQALHDYDHYLTDSDFSLKGEITSYNAIAKRAPSLEIQKILYSEIVLRSAAYLDQGQAPSPKIVFP